MQFERIDFINSKLVNKWVDICKKKKKKKKKK